LKVGCGLHKCVIILQHTAEDQAENEANMLHLQRAGQFSTALEQVKLAEHAELTVKQPDEPVKQLTELAIEPGDQVTKIVSAEQPLDQQIQLSGQRYGDEFPLSSHTNHKKLMNIVIPTKPICTRKLSTFKVCLCTYCHTCYALS